MVVMPIVPAKVVSPPVATLPAAFDDAKVSVPPVDAFKVNVFVP